MIKVAVTGACGRMGSKIIKTILKQDDMDVVAAIEGPNTPLEGKDVGEVIGIGEIGVEVNGSEKLSEVLQNKKPQVLVDFTIANAAVSTIKTTAKCGVNLVVGTTGFSDAEMTEIINAIEKNQVKAVISPNMAVGVNVFFKVLKDLATIIGDYDVEIIEAHHRHKKDAPSGTAVKEMSSKAKSFPKLAMFRSTKPLLWLPVATKVAVNCCQTPLPEGVKEPRVLPPKLNCRLAGESG